MGQGITLFWVVQSVDITPEPDEDEREAILVALAAEAAAQEGPSSWAAAGSPTRNDVEDAPYP